MGITLADVLKQLHLAARQGFCVYDENRWGVVASD